MVRFGVLGPVVADNEHGPVDLRGARQRAVLARLLIAGGRVVPIHRLIDDLWDVPPAGALGAVQTFVGALRKALEPDRAPRTASRLLVTVPPGYALQPHPDAVDAGPSGPMMIRSRRGSSGSAGSPRTWPRSPRQARSCSSSTTCTGPTRRRSRC